MKQFNPGDKVTCRYRENLLTGEAYTGVVLAQDDPRAWVGTLAFPGDEIPDVKAVARHVERGRLRGLFDDSVPVLWSFGKVYWQPVENLELLPLE